MAALQGHYQIFTYPILKMSWSLEQHLEPHFIRQTYSEPRSWAPNCLLSSLKRNVKLHLLRRTCSKPRSWARSLSRAAASACIASTSSRHLGTPRTVALADGVTDRLGREIGVGTLR